MQNGKWMRQGDFKAVSVAPPYGTGTWHLYNLADDPGETRDLAKEQPETVHELQAAWDRYADDVGVVSSQVGRASKAIILAETRRRFDAGEFFVTRPSRGNGTVGLGSAGSGMLVFNGRLALPPGAMGGVQAVATVASGGQRIGPGRFASGGRTRTADEHE